MNRDVFIFSRGRLKRKDNTLYFVDEQGLSKPLPVEQTENIHLFGQCDFNSSLLHLLTKHNVVLHIYNYYGYYDGTYYPRNSHVSGHTIVQQSAHVIDLSKRMVIAKAFVEGAVHHMQRNLRKYGEQVESYLQTLNAYTPLIYEANNIPELMGIEGKCRKIYYDSFERLFKSDFIWEYRSKRPPHDPANALISFGNSLMYTTVISEIFKTVLHPGVSYLHEPSSKRFSLSLDLSEIFKPLIVDSTILHVVNNRVITEKHFDMHDGWTYLNDEGRKRFIAAFDKKLKTTIKHRKLKRNVSYRYLIRLEAYKLIKHIIGDEKYKPFKAWW
ncbi:MAG: type I-B CRISPR-associated endonuclease Cas1 [Bacillaceae bacterium]|nr:type I-B CRISPR-associated endonuclease Cas1 [Bacillaceae bacterium]